MKVSLPTLNLALALVLAVAAFRLLVPAPTAGHTPRPLSPTSTGVVATATITSTPAITATPTITHTPTATQPHTIGLMVQHDEGARDALIVEHVHYHRRVNAFELLDLAGLQFESRTYAGLGEALCRIEAVGCPASDCFCSSKYWRLFEWKTGRWPARRPCEATGSDAMPA